MTIIDKAENAIKKWLFGKALKKGIVSLAKLVVSFATAKGISAAFVVNGIEFNLTDIGVMTAALNSLYEMLRNYLKVKWPEKFGWM